MSILHVNDGHGQDPDILSAAIHALKDFAPTFVPATDAPACVVACCPVCVGTPGAVGALKVEAVDVPKRLSWHCALHNGGFRGIQYALGKHGTAKVTTLRERLAWNHKVHPGVRYADPKEYDLAHKKHKDICTKSNAAPEVDPAADHQKEYRCENQRLILHRIKDIGHLTAMPVRCRRCVGCVSWLKAKRVSRLINASSGWDSVFLVSTEGPKAFAAITARFRRHNLERRTDDCRNPVQYISVPVAGRARGPD